MKYNIEEQLAVDALFRLASNLKEHESTCLDAKEIKAIKKKLGIDLHSATTNKTEMKKGFRHVRGKDKLMFLYDYHHPEFGWKYRQCWFPFQIKPK